MTGIRHVGIIMDGNGRWAAKRRLPRSAGHRAGAERVSEIVRAANDQGIAALTLYTFSSDNWKRPPEEVHGLMELLIEYLERMHDEIAEQGVVLSTIGSAERLPRWVRLPLEGLVEASASNDGMRLCLALSYDGRESILRAVQQALDAGVAPSELSVDTLDRFIETAPLGPADVIIRTGGDQRLSGFLPWESTYAELCFVPTMWPDFSAEELVRILRDCSTRERRFGGLPDAGVESAPAPPAARV